MSTNAASRKIGAEVAAPLARMWEGGSGPSHAALDSAFSAGGVDPDGLPRVGKQARVLAAMKNLDGEAATRLAGEIVDLLVTEGAFESEDERILKRIDQLRDSFARAGAALDPHGNLTWRNSPTRVHSRAVPIALAAPANVGGEPSPSDVEPDRAGAEEAAAQVESPILPSIGLLIDALRRVPEAVRPLASTRRKGKHPVAIIDEYDLQDLVEFTARLLYADTRAEEGGPSVAGSSGRVDFLVKAESTAIEVKVTRAGRSTVKLRDEIIVDKALYKEHPGVERLVAVVYDLVGSIDNPAGFEDGLCDASGDLPTTVLVVRWPPFA